MHILGIYLMCYTSWAYTGLIIFSIANGMTLLFFYAALV